MRITLNLATRPFADLGPAIKRLRIAMGVLALLAILLGLGLHAIHQKAEAARARDHSLDGQIAHIAQERQSYTDLMRQPPNAELIRQAAVLNKLFDEKAFSWTLAMEDLETVLPGGVQVTTLEPTREKDGHITLKLRVVGPRDRAVDLVRNLEHSRHFLLPRIVGENAQSTESSGQRLEPVSASNRTEFDLQAQYNPASPQQSMTILKSTKKSTDSDEPHAATSHPLHPVPLPGVGPGRLPYSGSPNPANTMPPGQMPPGSKSLPRPPSGNPLIQRVGPQ